MDQNAYQAIRERCASVDLTGRGKIRVIGDDRVRFLHAMCTNHVQQLIPGSGCYAFFLNPQGKILADANIFCMPDYLLLDTETETREKLTKHLEAYVIADDVTLHDFTETTATVGLIGPTAEAVLNELGGMPARAPFSLVEWEHGHIAHWSYTGGPGYMLLTPAEQKDALLARFTDIGVPLASRETADIVRLENARPRYGADFTEAQIPHETQQMQAIHFSKGCYLGQEIVERVRSRGHVNRLLTPVHIAASEPPARGAAVMQDSKSVGELESAAFSPTLGAVAAFAILRAEALVSGGPALTVEGSVLTPSNVPAPGAGR